MSRRDHLHRSRRSSSYAELPFVDPEEIDEGDPTRAGVPSCVDAADLAGLAAFSGCEDEPTRAPRPSHVELLARGAHDSGDDPTRSAHESYVALSELADAPAFDPLGGEAAWSPEAAAAAYERGFAEGALLSGEIEQDEVTSFVDRASLVAASELGGRSDDGPDSVTVFRASCVAPEERGSHGYVEDAHGEPEALVDDDEDVVSSAGYPAYAMSQAGEVSPYAPTESVASQRPPHPAARRSTPSAHEIAPSPSMRRSTHALELPAPPMPPTPAASIRRSLAPAPAPPATGRRSMHSVHPAGPQPTPSTGRRSMHSVHPAGPQPTPSTGRRSMHSVHPAGPQHAMAALGAPMAAFHAMPTMPSQGMRRSMPSMHPHPHGAPASMRGSMPSMHPHDSSAESPWIVTMGPTSSRRGAPIAQPAPFRVTASFIAAATLALLAVGVMVAGVLFVHFDNRAEPSSRATTAAVEVATPSTVAGLDLGPLPLVPPATITISSDDVSTTPVDPMAAVAPNVAAVAPSAPAMAPSEPAGFAPSAPSIAQSGPAVVAPSMPAAVAPSAPVVTPNAPVVTPSAPAVAPSAVRPNAPALAAAPAVGSPRGAAPAEPANAPRASTRGASAPAAARPPAATDVAPARAPAAKKKSGEQSIEDILNALGEEQISR